MSDDHEKPNRTSWPLPLTNPPRMPSEHFHETRCLRCAREAKLHVFTDGRNCLIDIPEGWRVDTYTDGREGLIVRVTCAECLLPSSTFPIIDTTNAYGVSIKAGNRTITVLVPLRDVQPNDALLVAAWIVTLAQPHARCKFEDILRAVQGL